MGEHQSNMKKTWELINLATKKCKKNKDESRALILMVALSQTLP
jgi:hypothetical protein